MSFSNLSTNSIRLLWDGNNAPVSQGRIDCNTIGYIQFSILCKDGIVLRGLRGYDPINQRDFMAPGGCGGAGDGTNWVPGIWYGLIDIYDTHFYVHYINLYTPQDGISYSNKEILAIYGMSYK